MKYLLCCLWLAFMACSSNTTATTQPQTSTPVSAAQNDTIQPGKVIPVVRLSTNPAQSYGLYIPHLDPPVKLPVIIFFDPHGDGSIPLNMYKDLAEEFHYILIGSNNSQNGMTFDQTSAIANNLVAEAHAKTEVDTNRIILCGFSGGAKVALLSGTMNKNVTAIVYAGAVTPVQPNHKISLLGFAGTGDLNYSDEVLFHNSLPETIDHYLVEWNGSHTWPSAEAFRMAFTWPYANIPKDKLAVIDSKKLNELTNEDNIKHELVKDLETKDIEWWKSKVAELNSHKKDNPQTERMLGFISLACYTYGGQALKQGYQPMAAKILTIYAIADPGNEDCKKMTAELNQMQQGISVHPSTK